MRTMDWPNLSKLCAGFMLATSLLLGSAIASTVTVDGVMMAGEYTGANSGMKELLWYNDHHSIYTEAAGNTNPLFWEINEDPDNNTYILNLFFEVPIYARRMIWVKDCNYGKTTDTDCDVIPIDYLTAYFSGTHHDEVKMDYKTQTESEYFKLNGLPTGDLKIFWQDEDNNPNDDFNWATSREYLLANNICTQDECLQFDRTASIEMMFLGLASYQSGYDLLNSAENMQLHLSDEAVGLPSISPVPVPAALPLFASALVGFGLLGYRRRKGQAA